MSAPSSHPQAVPVTEPKQPEKSLGELFADLGSELGALVRKELDLAKTEARREVRTAGQGAAAFAAAAVAGFLMLMFLSSAVAWLLDQWMNTALAFLIVAIIWAIVAAVAFVMGRQRLQTVEPIPQTVETIKEDVEWAKQQRT
jgi:F0F1-type ATP synthase assembly protein I